MVQGRRVRREDILEATNRLLATDGVAITMDDIAREAGVARRTLFRHFPSKEHLLAAATEAGMARWEHELRRKADDRPEDISEYLNETLTRAHALNERAGRGLRELASGIVGDGDVAGAAQARRTSRRTYVPKFVAGIWRASGGQGRPPEWVVDAYALIESVHAFYALNLDLGRDVEQVGRVTARIMEAVLQAAVEQQQRSGSLNEPPPGGVRQ